MHISDWYCKAVHVNIYTNRTRKAPALLRRIISTAPAGPFTCIVMYRLAGGVEAHAAYESAKHEDEAVQDEQAGLLPV